MRTQKITDSIQSFLKKKQYPQQFFAWSGLFKFFVGKGIFQTIPIVTIFLSIHLFSVAQTFNLSTEVDKKKITIGEHLKLLVTLTFPRSKHYQLPILDKEIGKFVIKNFRLIKETHEHPEYIEQSIEYTITTYQIGHIEIPSLSIKLPNLTLKTEPIPITVESVLFSDDVSLEPLKPNLMTEGKLSLWVYLIGTMVIFLIVGMIFGIIKYYLKKKQKPYYVLIEEQLNNLANKNNHLNTKKKFYFRFDHLVKQFLAEREKNPFIITMTTKQLKQLGTENQLSDKNFFFDFFDYADQIKFSRSLPNKDKSYSLIEEFREVIHKEKELHLNKTQKRSTT